MAELNRVLQLAVRELLIAAYNNSPKKWSDFARDLAELDIEQMARLREANTPRERPKLKITEEFALKLVAYCKETNGLTVSDELKTRLGTLWDHKNLAIPMRSENSASGSAISLPPTDGFIPALNLGRDTADKSIEDFSGHYLHFALNEAAEIVTAKCHLTRMRGADGAPVYESKRNFQQDGVITAVGVYFCEPPNLYLLASPRKSADLRLAVFRAASSHKQEVNRGTSLGVNPKKTILASRCALFRGDLDAETRERLWDQPMQVNEFKAIGARFEEMARYLYGEEKEDYDIKLIKLTAPE
jgi:hypothetical protein